MSYIAIFYKKYRAGATSVDVGRPIEGASGAEGEGYNYSARSALLEGSGGMPPQKKFEF